MDNNFTLILVIRRIQSIIQIKKIITDFRRPVLFGGSEHSIYTNQHYWSMNSQDHSLQLM